MGSGKYHHRIRIERDEGTTVGSYNEPVADWQHFAWAWAEIDTGSSRKFYAAQQVHQDLTHLVTMPWLDALVITEKLRIKWGTRTLKLLGPPIDVRGRHMEYEIRCVEEA